MDLENRANSSLVVFVYFPRDENEMTPETFKMAAASLITEAFV